VAEAKWTMRLSRLALRLALGAIGVAALGVGLARYDLIAKIVGFGGLALGGVLSVLAVVLGVIGLALNAKYPTSTRKTAIIALVLSLPFAGFFVTRPIAAGPAPAIHDLTTDLANPPAFKRLALRADNLAGVGTLENWRAIHARAYPDLKPLRIERAPAVVLADAARLAQAQGWDIALQDAGQIEATASVSLIRFHDDVILRVTPLDGGRASLVDMRSVSRIGVGDLGVNAKRIRSFLKGLEAST